MRHGVICCILVFCCSTASVNGSILSGNEWTIDFTDPNDARSKAIWSEPNHITITKEGLGWDGQKDASRDFWIQTTELAVGLSWRPVQSVHVTVKLEPTPSAMRLDNGKRPWIQPSVGAIFVRHSPDAKYWSSWQAIRVEPLRGGATALLSIWSGSIVIPKRDRVEYEEYMRQYQRLDVPWKSDEEALVRWIVERDPNFFKKRTPFIGYLQFLYEGSLYGGQRIKRFHATANWGVGGRSSPPKDPNAFNNRTSTPWRYRSPGGWKLKRGLVTAKIGLDNTNIRFKKDFSVPIIIENHTDKPVQIDTSPDVIGQGGAYLEKGSRCVLSVTQDQDKNGQFDFFSTVDMKVESPDKTLNSFTIGPGKTHTLEFRISPWGPNLGSLPSYVAPGPAEIRGELKVLINGQELRVPMEPVSISFVD